MVACSVACVVVVVVVVGGGGFTLVSSVPCNPSILKKLEVANPPDGVWKKKKESQSKMRDGTSTSKVGRAQTVGKK